MEERGTEGSGLEAGRPDTYAIIPGPRLHAGTLVKRKASRLRTTSACQIRTRNPTNHRLQTVPKEHLQEVRVFEVMKKRTAFIHCASRLALA